MSELKEVKENIGRQVEKTNLELKEIKKENLDNLSIQNNLNLEISKEIQTAKNEITSVNSKVMALKDVILIAHPNCKEGWTKYLLKCYKMIKQSKSWSTTLCQSEGGSLVTIKDAEMNNFIFSLTQGYNAWLGGHDSKSEGTWEWVDGTRMDHIFTNWHTGEPNNSNWGEDCMKIRNFDNKWNDAPCSRGYYYVCQM